MLTGKKTKHIQNMLDFDMYKILYQHFLFFYRINLYGTTENRNYINIEM